MKKLLSVLLVALILASAVSFAEVEPYNWQDQIAVGDKVDWRSILQYYRDDDDTRQLIFVKYTGGSECEVQVYLKDTEENNA